MKLFTIPNIITLANLICGVAGIWFLFDNEVVISAYLIFLALVLDYADGFVARLTNSYSEIGKQLDSLADLVSFGVLPGFILLHYLNGESLSNLKEVLESNPLVLVALLPVLASALRLAKFNIDTRQTDQFMGVPTPANAMIIASIPLIQMLNPNFFLVLNHSYILIAYSLIISYLLISDIPMMALKFKDFSWNSNKSKYLFLLICLGMFLIFKIAAIPLVILFYIIYSLLIKSIT